MNADSSLWARVSRSMLGRYAIALGVTALGLLARWALGPLLGNLSPYTTLYPGIAFLAIFVGLGPSIFAAILGLIGANHWFNPPPGGFFEMDIAHLTGNVTFLTVSGCIIAAGEASRRLRRKLERAENLFETFLDNSPGTEFLKDEEGRYVYVNKTITGHFGGAFIGKTDLEIFPGPYAEQWRANDLKVLKENRAQEFIETSHQADGDRIWLSVKFPVVDAEGRKLLGRKSFDLTEQKRAEEEIARLQQENAQRMAAELEAMTRLQDVGNRCVRPGTEFHATLEAIMDGAIFLMGAKKGTMQLLEPSAGALILAAQRGFEEPFLSFFSVVKEDEASARGAVMRSRERIVVEDVTKSKIVAGAPSLRVLLDAGVRAVQSTPLVSSTGKLLGIISTHFGQPHRPGERELRLMDLLARQAADYMERKQAEGEIRATSELLQRFLDTAPSGLTRCSRDLRYQMVNPAYARMMALPAEQITGRPIVDVIGTEAWEKVRPYVERVLRGERVEYESELPYATGGRRYSHVIYTPEMDRKGEVVGWVASVTDITESMRVERHLAKVEKLAAAGQLAAALAHEINNPLSSVVNALYLLNTNSGLDAAASTLAKTAASELDRVSRIVRQSLAYYRVGTKANELDLGASVQESLQIYEEKFQRAGIHVRKKITPKTLMVGFPDEIRQVIDNLLLNALEATPSGGRLAVCVHWSRSWKSHKEGVRLTIADTGPGILKEQMARVFEPFFTTKSGKGTGLGLWVVSGIVAKHDGNIRVRSAEIKGKSGTVVSILWPSNKGSTASPRARD